MCFVVCRIIQYFLRLVVFYSGIFCATHNFSELRVASFGLNHICLLCFHARIPFHSAFIFLLSSFPCLSCNGRKRLIWVNAWHQLPSQNIVWLLFDQRIKQYKSFFFFLNKIRKQERKIKRTEKEETKNTKLKWICWSRISSSIDSNRINAVLI